MNKNTIEHEDFLGRAVDIEEEFEDIGYEEGLQDGQRSGELEGRELGCEYGFSIGRDLGFYDGWIDELLKASKQYPGFLSARVQRQLQSIKKMIDETPTENTEHANFGERLKEIQRKFKAVSATLGINISSELPANTLSY